MEYDYYYICNNSYIGNVVHHKDCRFLRNDQKVFLGTFHDYPQAGAVAHKSDPETDQCQACLELQHKKGALNMDISAHKFKSAVSEHKISLLKVPASNLKKNGTGYVNRVPRKHLWSALDSKSDEDE